jgi:hypothetical protein
MSFYADAQFNTPVLVPAVFGGTASATGTGTAITVTSAYQLPQFIRRTKIANVNVATTVAPAGGFTGGLLVFLNGTNTFAVATIVGTAGSFATGTAVTITTANTTFAAGAGPTVNIVGTCTSAGVLAGGYSVWFDQQELYA